MKQNFTVRHGALDGVEAFLSVAEHRNFRRAAAGLGVTPSAISQAVRALEARVGAALFTRTTRRVGLPEAGAVAARAARGVRRGRAAGPPGGSGHGGRAEEALDPGALGAGEGLGERAVAEVAVARRAGRRARRAAGPGQQGAEARGHPG